MPKAKKDPNAPKKVKTGFMCFSIEERPKLVKESPGLPFGEYGKKIGALWRAMSDDEKAPWLKKSEKDKARYAKEKAAYDKKN